MVLKQYKLTRKEKEAHKNLKFRTDITPIKTIVKVTALFTKFESGEITLQNILQGNTLTENWNLSFDE